MSASAEYRDQILALSREGMRPCDIRRQLGCGANIVAGVLNRAREAGLNTAPKNPLFSAPGQGRAPSPRSFPRAKPKSPSPRPTGSSPVAGSLPSRGEGVKRKPPLRSGERVATAQPAGEVVHAAHTLEQVQAAESCRWPFGDRLKGGLTFCGRQRAQHDLPFAADQEPYCPEHRAAGRSSVTPSLRSMLWGAR